MKQRALIVEPSRFFQNIIVKAMQAAGVECEVYAQYAQALNPEHDDYAFILVSRELEGISGEIFLKLFSGKYGLGDALTILVTANDDDEMVAEAKKAGFGQVINRNQLASLQEVIRHEVNARTLDLAVSVLLVEDSPSIAKLIVNLFHAYDGQVHHVDKIDDMKRVFDRQEVDLVITDYHLNNNETGDDVIQYIRQQADMNKANTPILVVSSESSREKRTALLRRGANDFILKPYDSDELLVRASNLISARKLYRQSQRQQQLLMKMALTDQLTGLYNRHSLYDLAPKYINNARRHQTELRLLVIDLDYFKKINDSRGHSIGDAVLRSVATTLKSSCRAEDMAARFGGEEFVILLAGCDSPEAEYKAEQLREMIAASMPEGVAVTASIGITGLQHDEDFKAMFERADKAVYQAKETGRNRVVML